ncbi:NAD-P-binding protein, partial [Mycena filopes]
QIVLITGCSAGGIGFTMCTEFAGRGCQFVYATTRNMKKMEGLQALTNVELMALDVTDTANVLQVVESIVEKEGRIDILVNNAGMACFGPIDNPRGPILEVPLQEIQDVYDTNVLSILRMSRAVIPHMAAQKSGLIVNISSIVGEIPTPWAGIYASSKAAVNSISEVLHMECKPLNVKVMLIIPGGVKTNVAQNAARRFELQPTSLYTKYYQCIVNRVWASQTASSMSADDFARLVVTKALMRDPPFRLSIGSYTVTFGILKWLPRLWALNFMWKTFDTPPK